MHSGPIDSTPLAVRDLGGSTSLPPRRRSKSAMGKGALPALAFLTPFLLLLLVFQYIPLAVMARSSVLDYSLFNPDNATFVGADNFIRIFTDAETIQSLLITFAFILGVLVLVVPASFALAVFLNGKLPARALVRTMIFLPVVTSSVVVATLWTFLLNETGLINSVLATVGIPSAGFLTDTTQALPAIIVMTVWQQVGLATVLFLGGLQAVPAELSEAAHMDGAGPLRRTLSITLPLLSRTTLFIVVVMTVFALQAFAPAYIMTGGAPQGTTNLIIYHIYKTAFILQQPGYASAMALVVLAFAIIISLIQMRLLRTRWNY
ncbi:sugar ABC transporter permease [Salinibacterium sp. NYA9b]